MRRRMKRKSSNQRTFGLMVMSELFQKMILKSWQKGQCIMEMPFMLLLNLNNHRHKVLLDSNKMIKRLENGFNMERELKWGRARMLTLETGFKERERDREYVSILMAISMLVSSKMTSNMVLESRHGVMERFMMVDGKTRNNMVLVTLWTKMESREMGNGKMEIE
jgi:hypothetical protein